jgi:predicted dienelactone hydrolase
VGRIEDEVRDGSRREIYGPDPSALRELVIWIWYPAGGQSDAPLAPYLPEPWTPAASFLGVDTARVRGHAVEHSPLAPDRDQWPALLLSPSGMPPLLLSALAEELASHGYLVVGVNHTYETAVTVFVDGRTVQGTQAATAGAMGPQSDPYQEQFRKRAAVCDYKAGDLTMVADHLERLAAGSGMLARRIDLGRIGSVGHSFGGDAALEWCRIDARCRAAVNVDGAIWTEVGRVGLPRPAMAIVGEHAELTMSGQQAVDAGITTDAVGYEAEAEITFGGWRTIQERANPGYVVRVSGSVHVSFIDLPFLPVREDAPIGAMLASARLDPLRAWRITSDLVLAFFGRHFDGDPGTLLDDPGATYPEVSSGPPGT